MSENRQYQSQREMVCVDTYRVLDCCRDKDCFENVRVFLTACGEELLKRGAAIRAKAARILWAYIDIDPVPFNRGFYQLTIKLYIRIICEACVAPGNVREFEGISVVEKKVILFGSEGNISVFKSETGCSGFCPSHSSHGCSRSTNLPIAVLEAVEPIILASNIVESHRCKCCCTCCEEIPDNICECLSDRLCDGGELTLAVTLGLFSVVRIERPAQYLINAVEYCVPEKECVEATDNDPCKLFHSMKFPISEFCPPSMGSFPKSPSLTGGSNSCGCS
ncbi:MAG: hypothetical protein IJ389_02895 [Clostridia bacterium]|nr:hypothetical protein [Clostridia bacterium]